MNREGQSLAESRRGSGAQNTQTLCEYSDLGTDRVDPTPHCNSLNEPTPHCKGLDNPIPCRKGLTEIVVMTDLECQFGRI